MRHENTAETDTTSDEKMMAAAELSDSIVEPLLAWYDRGRRILPWREEPTPYHVWLSEIMLQQTRVEAVKLYYDRFLQALPDIAVWHMWRKTVF